MEDGEEIVKKDRLSGEEMRQSGSKTEIDWLLDALRLYEQSQFLQTYLK